VEATVGAVVEAGGGVCVAAFSLCGLWGECGEGVFICYCFFILSLGSFCLGELALFPIMILGGIYEWVFWFPVPEEPEKVVPVMVPASEAVDPAVLGVGVVLTDLRPVGLVEFNGERREARSSQGLIRKGEEVVVECMNGREVVVRCRQGGEV